MGEGVSPASVHFQPISCTWNSNSSSSNVTAPYPRAGHSICLAGSLDAPVLVLFGGTSNMEDGDTLYHNDVWTIAFDTSSTSQIGQWTPLVNDLNSLAPSPRSLCAVAPLMLPISLTNIEENEKKSISNSEKSIHNISEAEDSTGKLVEPGLSYGEILIFGGYGLVEINKSEEPSSDDDSQNQETENIFVLGEIEQLNIESVNTSIKDSSTIMIMIMIMIMMETV
jgi:hypothetical protein